MRQIWITRAGPPEVLQLKEAPDPEPKAGEVRIRVEASLTASLEPRTSAPSEAPVRNNAPPSVRATPRIVEPTEPTPLPTSRSS